MKKTMMSGLMGAACALAAAGTPASAAGLIGTSVTVGYQYLAISSSDSVLANGGVSISCPGAFGLCSMLTAPTQTVGFGATAINYTYAGTGSAAFNNVEPNGFIFSNLNPGFAITGVDLATGISGFDASRISFTADTVTVDMHGLQLGTSNYFTVTLLGAVPEPASWAMLVAGFGLIGAAMRRRPLVLAPAARA